MKLRLVRTKLIQKHEEQDDERDGSSELSDPDNMCLLLPIDVHQREVRTISSQSCA
jgi:hypothetical protein